MRNRTTAIGWAVALAVLCLSGPSQAQRKWIEPPQSAPVAPNRPDWPASHPTICSDRRPLCVHAKRPVAEIRIALDALEQAYAKVVDVLEWRAPFLDHGLGDTAGFDVYLTPTDLGWEVRPDPLTDVTQMSKSSAFALVDPAGAGSCHLPYALSAALARAGIFALDAAANDALANATAAYIASLVEPCTTAFAAHVDDFQVQPHLAVSHPTHHRGRGAMLFPWYLQSMHGRGNPADLLHALWTLSVQPAPPDPSVLFNEPDFIDATQILASDVRRSLPDLWLDFSVARAFVGDRDDGIHLPESRFLGAAGAVRFEWSVPYSSLPRRLAPQHPVEPSGASYVWLSLDDAPDDAGLGFRGDWESPDVFRFSLVLVGHDGRAMSRHDPVSPQRGTTSQANLEILHDAAGLLIVACNTGPVLPDIAFDPDSRPYTARRFTVSLFNQK